MCKLCLLVTCLACAGNGRRLKALFEKHLGSQDVKRQQPMVQMNSSAGSMAHVQADRSGRGQQSMANPGKFVPILLTLFNPAGVFAPSSNVFSLNSSIYGNTQTPMSRNSDGTPQTPMSRNSDGTHASEIAMPLGQKHVGEVPPEFDGPTVRAVVSVIWEGLDLRIENLLALEKFREAHPGVPLSHFLNAAYFTKSKGQSIHEWSPYQALSPIDEIGLHVNGLKSLVESSGVQYRPEHNILQSPEELEESLSYEKYLEELVELKTEWDDASERIQVLNPLLRDVGLDTDISSYSVEELQAIISTATAILRKQGLTVGTSFRAGAFLAGPSVLKAIRREGFLVSSSTVGFDKMIRKHVRQPSPAEKMFRKDRPCKLPYLSGITSKSQPFLWGAPKGEWILEMPVTGGIADYNSVEDMVDHIDSAVQALDSGDRFVHIGFHQETAAMTIERVVAAITEIKRKHRHQVVFETLGASAQRAVHADLTAVKSTIEPHAMHNS